MLGEDHSLVNDFPELKAKIAQRIGSDATFAIKAKKYAELDKEIRELELSNSPINDLEMSHLKNARARLKDEIYNDLVKH